MNKYEFIQRFPWIDPLQDLNKLIYRQEVQEHNAHYAVRGACHQIVSHMSPIHSKHLEHIDGYDWELFHASHRGTIDGVEYLWGMFVEGMGFFNIMVPVELSRNLSDVEREAWSKVTLGMYGCHSGNFSYSFPSGVIANTK